MLPLSASAKPLRALERRLWILEHISQGVVPSSYGSSRVPVTLRAGNFSDALTGEFSALMPVGPVEIRGRYIERYFLRSTDDGRAYAGEWDGERRSAGVEVASYLVSRHNEYGRLGVEYIRSFPAYRGLALLKLQTGLLEAVDRGWSLAIGAAYGMHIEGTGGDFIAASIESHRRIADSASLGGAMFFTYRSRKFPQAGLHELVLLSVGPSLRWGQLTVRALARVFLDKRVNATGPATNPGGWAMPDLSLEWGLR